MVYLTHGVVPIWDKERISHALMLPENDFKLHLQNRKTQYVPLVQALGGHADALTVDDATFAGLNAALLARQHGHAVTWFVNGFHLETGTAYFPFQLSSMLDRVTRTRCLFKQGHWNLRTRADRRILRLHLKERYMQMRHVDQVKDLLQEVAGSLDVDGNDLEHPLRTVGLPELQVAIRAGVDIQNHGWSHLNPCVLSHRQRTREIKANEFFLSQYRATETRIYAPPFGKRVPLAPGVSHFQVLAERVASASNYGNVVNRTELAPVHVETYPSRAAYESTTPANEVHQFA